MEQRKLTILVTGASRGIGASIAVDLGAQHNVILLGRDKVALTSVAERIPNQHARIVHCDMGAAASIENVCNEIKHVDVLISNAGIANFADAVTMPYDVQERQVVTNLLGPMLMMSRFLPEMLSRKRGMLITVNSVAATTVFRGAAAYSASKSGLLAYTRSLRQEVREHNIKVVDLLVGATETEIWTEDARVQFGHRMMTAEHIGKVVGQIVNGFDDDRMMIEEVTIRPQLGDL